MQPESGQITYARSKFPHLIQLCSSKEGPDHLVKKNTHIQSGWPGQGLAKCIWSRSKLVCKNHRAWFWQNATGPLPVSHFQTQLRSSTDDADHIVQNQPRSDLVLAVRFWPNGSGPEASRYAKIIGPASGQHFQANPDWMRIRSSMFAGLSGWSYVAKSERANSGQVKSRDKGDIGLVTGVWVCVSDQNLSLRRTWKLWWILWICL